MRHSITQVARSVLRRSRRTAFDALFWATHKKIVVFNGTYIGIGNRLKALASYDRLFGLHRAHVCWCVDEWVPKPLSYVLDLSGVGELREHTLSPTRLLPSAYTYPSIPFSDVRGAWRLAVDEANADDLPLAMGRGYPVIDFAYAATPPKYIAAYVDFFARVRPSARVMHRMNEALVSQEHICVHVRTPGSTKDLTSTRPIERYLEAMQAAPPTQKFFLSAHDPTAAKIICDAFPGRVHELPGKRYDSLVDGVADLFLLSKGHTLIASQGSTFSEVAWWLGNARQTVVCVKRKQ